jgi:hypothetical protein
LWKPQAEPEDPHQLAQHLLSPVPLIAKVRVCLWKPQAEPEDPHQLAQHLLSVPLIAKVRVCLWKSQAEPEDPKIPIHPSSFLNIYVSIFFLFLLVYSLFV